MLELKKQLLDLDLPPNACLFTADTVSMYTNIPTHMTLNLIGKYLTHYQHKCNGEYPHDAVQAGLQLIMTLNIFTFGDPCDDLSSYFQCIAIGFTQRQQFISCCVIHVVPHSDLEVVMVFDDCRTKVFVTRDNQECLLLLQHS